MRTLHANLFILTLTAAACGGQSHFTRFAPHEPRTGTPAPRITSAETFSDESRAPVAAPSKALRHRGHAQPHEELTAKRSPRRVGRKSAKALQHSPHGGVLTPSPPPEPAPQTEHFTDYGVNDFVDTRKDALSTFALDVDTGSYAIARSSLRSRRLPPFQAVRAEEFINYFDYEYRGPTSGPFSVHLDAAPSPFHPQHHLLRVGIQAKRIARADRKPVHLVYLVDTSGSMRSANKLDLAKRSLRLLTTQLNPHDTVALCTYAGSTRVVLHPTGADNRERILSAIDDLTSGGGTAMGSGLDLAYRLADETRRPGHVNRVIVLSDGDANIGRTSHHALLKRIDKYRKRGITLSTVGFGRGNYKDTMMEQLANKGDGNYSYIDTMAEAKRVFAKQLGGLLQVVARDTKLQVEFDPALVSRYRLIGYENRNVADRDFRNDHVDAGEVGAGHNVTALYEVVFRSARNLDRSAVTVRLRYKQPTGSEKARELMFMMNPNRIRSTFEDAPRNFRLATAAAGLAEVLRKSPYAQDWSLPQMAAIARRAEWGKSEQRELARLIDTASNLTRPRSRPTAVIAH